MKIKSIPCAPDYEINDCGFVFSKERIVTRKNGRKYFVKRRKMKLTIDNRGYNRCALIVNKKLTTLKVHRLVCETFYGKSKLEVNHKNGNKQDNRLENLEFCTRSQNIVHAFKNKLAIPMRGSRNPTSKIDEIKALTIKTFLMSGIGPSEISRKFNVSINITKDISKGKTWKHL